MKSKLLRGLLPAALAVVAAMALLAPTAPAATPAPGYGQFASCPTQAEIPAVVACVRSDIKGGHFKMGNKKVPISKPMTLSGGLNAEFKFVKATLPPVAQQVPGGVIGLTGLDWLVNFLDIDSLQLFAVTELAGLPTLGENLTLPIKVRLINPVLGNKCYVGSNSNPIVLNLTEKTTSPPPPNQPISGKEFEFSEDAASGILTFKNGVLVDNSFAAPGASGCTLTLFGFIPISINGLVNSQSGLPAPAGTNETVQNVDMEIVDVARVYP
jgi:hypothetical protein